MHGNRKAGRKSFKEPESGNDANEYYDLGQGNRGKCLIFNNKTFNIKGYHLSERLGSDVDAKALDTCFTKLGYYVQQHKNQTKEDITNKLKEVAKQTELSSVVVIVLTHQYNKRLAAKDCLYCMEDLFEPFRGDNSDALVGRPKIFFIQSCFVDDNDWPLRTRVSDLDEKTLLSVWADFLVFHSTVPGYLSWRKKGEIGSIVMQNLAQNIEKYHTSDNLESILNLVSKEAVNFIEETKSKLKLQKVKAIKTIVRSTLTHGIHFNPLSSSIKLQSRLIKSGRCLIINNEKFPPKDSAKDEAGGTREGSNKDVEDLKGCFESLKFTVETCIDKDKTEILNAIEREAKASAVNDCFVCIISTHGGTPTKLFGVKKAGTPAMENDPYDIEEVFLKLDGLEELRNKPVIVLIQACQGKLVDHGTGKRESSGNGCQTNKDIELNVPWPNFFVARSSYPGYFCYRGDVKGSWFLQSVVKVIKKFGSSRVDIQTMSYLANHRVSKRVCKIKNTEGFVIETAKQTCCFWSTLTEKVAFQVDFKTD